MVWGGIAHRIKSQLIIVAGNMTAVRYRDEILRPVAVPLVQQRNATTMTYYFILIVNRNGKIEQATPTEEL